MVYWKNDIPISDAVGTGSGDVLILEIGGWENALYTYSSRGIIYLNVSSTEVACYSKIIDFATSALTFDSSKQICATPLVGATGSDEQNMTASNSSGITGKVAYTAGATGIYKALISFCDETDMRFYIRQLSTALDSNSQHEGKTRFRMALMESFNIVKEGVKNMIRNQTERKNNNDIDLTQLYDPGQYRQCQAMIASALLLRNFGGPSALDYISYADQLWNQGTLLLSSIVPLIDEDDDEIIDAEIRPVIRLRRS